MTRFTRNRTYMDRLVPAAIALLAPAVARASSGNDSLLGGDIGNAVFTLIIFGVVIAVLGKFAWKPVLRVLHERETTIRESLESARSEREKAATLLADYQAQLDKARTEASVLVEEGRRDAEAVRQRILAEARQETADLTARARREIQLATDAAVKELFDKTAELSVDVAGRVLSKELSAGDHRRLVDESIAEMRASGKAKLN